MIQGAKVSHLVISSQLTNGLKFIMPFLIFKVFIEKLPEDKLIPEVLLHLYHT